MTHKLRGIGRLNQVTAAGLGALLMALALALAWLNFKQAAERQFNAESSKLHKALVHGLAGGEAGLDGLSSLFAAIPYADAEGFRVVSARFLERHPFLTTTAYARYTDGHDRVVFEQSMKAGGYAGFAIKRFVDGQLQPVGDREFYLPLMFIEPFSVRQIMMLGLDIGTVPDLRPALERAIDRNRNQGTTTVGGLAPLGGYWIFQPLYAGKLLSIEGRADRRALRGMVVVGIDLPELLQQLHVPENIHVSLNDLAGDRQDIAGVGRPPAESGLLLARDFDLGSEGHPLLLKIRKHIYLNDIPTASFLFALLVSLLLAALLVLVARTNANRARELVARNDEIGRQVAMKTKDLEQARTELQRSLSLLDGTLESTGDGILVLGKNQEVLHYNNRFAEMWNLPRIPLPSDGSDVVIPKMLEQLVDPDKLELRLKELYVDAPGTGTHRLELKDGRVFQQYSQPHGVGATLAGRVWSFHDVTEFLAVQRALEEKEVFLNRLAKHDSLTTLPNRLFFVERLQQAIEASCRNDDKVLSVMFVDLDGFKPINDSLGHDIGDKVLRCIGERLRGVVGTEFSVARLGGDEFTVLVEGARAQEDIAALAGHIQQEVEAPIHVSGYELHVTASIGISLYPRDGADAESLLRNADAAMYSAKKAGRNSAHFYSADITETAYQLLQLENRLRGALGRNELYLVYQPEVELSSGRVVAAEALLRWRDSIQGELEPVSFIPIAEKTGMILPIGEWVLRSACRQWRKWRQAGLELERIAVNLSARQLQHETLYNSFLAILQETGCPANRLELEISEDFVVHQGKPALRILERFRELGVVIAIDDFGTGYASLNHLKNLSATKLKIDRSFIRDAVIDPDDEAIVRSIVALGKALKMTTVAEGVETPEQDRFVTMIGCDQGQGYRYGRPLAAEDLFDLVANQEVPDARAVDSIRR